VEPPATLDPGESHVFLRGNPTTIKGTQTLHDVMISANPPFGNSVQLDKSSVVTIEGDLVLSAQQGVSLNGGEVHLEGNLAVRSPAGPEEARDGWCCRAARRRRSREPASTASALYRG
jgi:hypothetical protein